MISAKIICDSISEQGKRITTFELEYPRFIHGEIMTHRMLSKNATSSRAIPVSKMIEQVRIDPAMPIHWGKNQAGMQANEELRGYDLLLAKLHWSNAAKETIRYAEYMNLIGAHKQIVNRLLEPFQWMKTIVTATEFDNFFNLRCHKDAQPEIKALADLMYKAYNESTPQLLYAGEWHTPYVKTLRADGGELIYCKSYDEDSYGTVSIEGMTSEEAIKVSSSCCAQVSFRKRDDSLDKALNVYARLVDSKPVHASPFEHVATPMEFPNTDSGRSWEEGVTHMTYAGELWSGNFCGWIQYRQLIKDNVCWDYDNASVAS